MGPTDVWGVNRGHMIYKKTKEGWEKIPGGLKDISVGKDSVWGVNKYNDIYMRTGGGNWQKIGGKLMQVSILVLVVLKFVLFHRFQSVGLMTL